MIAGLLRPPLLAMTNRSSNVNPSPSLLSHAQASRRHRELPPSKQPLLPVSSRSPSILAGRVALPPSNLFQLCLESLDGGKPQQAVAVRAFGTPVTKLSCFCARSLVPCSPCSCPGHQPMVAQLTQVPAPAVHCAIEM